MVSSSNQPRRQHISRAQEWRPTKCNACQFYEHTNGLQTELTLISTEDDTCERTPVIFLATYQTQEHLEYGVLSVSVTHVKIVSAILLSFRSVPTKKPGRKTITSSYPRLARPCSVRPLLLDSGSAGHYERCGGLTLDTKTWNLGRRR